MLITCAMAHSGELQQSEGYLYTVFPSGSPRHKKSSYEVWGI
jgi:hypothetical protein